MRIAHYSYSKAGGAGVVAQLLNKQMNFLNHESSHFFEVESDLRSEPSSDISSLLRSVADTYIIRRSGSSSFFSVLRSQPRHQPDIKSKDVIHLHWWQGLDLAEVRRKNPSAKFFVSLHDDRSFTGGCHSAGSCDGPLRRCTQCPMARKIFWSSIESNFQISRQALSLISPVTFLAPNEWIAERANRFGLGQIGDIVTIPNPVDPVFETQGYRGRKRQSENMIFGFVAQNPTDSNKRLSLAVKTVQILRDKGMNATLDVVGGRHTGTESFVRFHGEQKPETLAQSAKNWSALLLTSKQETSPLVIAEMAFMGIPTVSAELGGSKTSLTQLGLPASVDIEREGLETYANVAKKLAEDFGKTKSDSLAKLAKSNFSLESVAEKTLATYRAAMKEEH